MTTIFFPFHWTFAKCLNWSQERGFTVGDFRYSSTRPGSGYVLVFDV